MKWVHFKKTWFNNFAPLGLVVSDDCFSTKISPLWGFKVP